MCFHPCWDLPHKNPILHGRDRVRRTREDVVSQTNRGSSRAIDNLRIGPRSRELEMQPDSQVPSHGRRTKFLGSLQRSVQLIASRSIRVTPFVVLSLLETIRKLDKEP